MATAHVMYGVVINDALRHHATTLDELITLRDHARAILAGQGDLAGALAKLEAEIGKRQST